MPPVFKAIITISVWLLFIKALLSSLTAAITIGGATLTGATPPMVGVAACGVGGAELLMACIGAWLRQKVE